MPCYITVKIIQEVFEDLPSMKKACKEMGLRLEERGGKIWIGGTIEVTKRNSKYVMSTTNESMLKSLMDEYAAAKIAKEASRKNMQVTRKKVGNEIRLTVVQN